MTVPVGCSGRSQKPTFQNPLRWRFIEMWADGAQRTRRPVVEDTLPINVAASLQRGIRRHQ